MFRRLPLPHARLSSSISCLVILLIIASACVPLFMAGVGPRSAFAEDAAATPVSGEAGVVELETESEAVVPVAGEGQGNGIPPDEPSLPEPVDAVVEDDTLIEPAGPETSSDPTGDAPQADASPDTAEESAPVQQRHMAPVEIAAESEADAPVSGSVTIAATDQYGTPLPGIEFQIPSPYGAHLPPLYSGSTNASGYILVESLLLDTYTITVTQVSIPTGCVPAGSQAVDLTTETPHLDLHFVSTCETLTSTGSVTMSATDQFGRPLSGIEFLIPSPYGAHLPPLFSGSTNAGGVVMAGSLLLDTYMITVTQVSASPGCLPAGSQAVELTFHVPDLTLHFVNTCELTTAVGSVTIALTDQHGTPLPGVSFSKLSPIAYSPPQYEYAGATDGNGVILVEALAVEEYAVTFQQRSALDGCTVAGDQTVVLTVDAPHPTLHFVNVCDTVPTVGSLMVQTWDQDANPLAGVTYEMRQDGAVVESWVSGSAVTVLRDLPLDTPFSVHQVAVPVGCVAEPDQTLTISADQLARAMAFTNTCTLPDATGDITVSKIDQYFTLRAGAEFELLQSGTVVHRWTSTNLAGETIPGLALDVEYTLHEVTAPLGCRAGEDLTLTLSTAEPSQAFAIRNECSPNNGTITITKTDQHGEILAGVEFHILNPDGSIANLGATGDDGIVTITTLYPLVAYTIHEVAAPAGCVAAMDEIVTLDVDDPHHALTIVNECEGEEPSPSPSPSPSSSPTPSTPESTPAATPTEVTGTPTATPTEATGTPTATPTSLTPTPASTPASSTTGTGPGTPLDTVTGSAPDPATSSIHRSGEHTVLALPNTGDMKSGDAAKSWAVLLATSGMLLIAAVGARLHRE